jgi:hypothetical protein
MSQITQPEVNPDDPNYAREYNRGWRLSERVKGSLDDLDRSGAPEAAYDGYYDSACGRQKWTWRKARRAGFEDMNAYLATLTENERRKAMGMREI